MKKTLLLTIFLALNPLNADTTNMSEQEMINEIMKMQQQIKESKERVTRAKAKTEAVKKLGRTVDKLAKKLGVDN
jgi:hypothetical protein